jgi:ABC-2 type transport system permease protein
MKKLETPIDLKAVKVTKTGEIEKGDPLQLFFTSFAFLMLMFFLIITTGQMLVRSTIEEKTNRIVEVLVSSAPSTDLMVGKIIGLSGLGLTQVLVWTAIGLFIAMSAHVVTITVWQLLLFISYFILGYLFFAALFVAIGSVLTTEQEAQQWMQYLSMVFAIPLVFAISGIENPNAVVLRVLEFIPLFTPMIMALRIPLNAMPVWEIVGTIFVLSVSVIATMWAAGKVFRVGILIYGKKPSFDEIIRWLRSA